MFLHRSSDLQARKIHSSKMPFRDALHVLGALHTLENVRNTRLLGSHMYPENFALIACTVIPPRLQKPRQTDRHTDGLTQNVIISSRESSPEYDKARLLKYTTFLHGRYSFNFDLECRFK